MSSFLLKPFCENSASGKKEEKKKTMLANMLVSTASHRSRAFKKKKKEQQNHVVTSSHAQQLSPSRCGLDAAEEAARQGVPPVHHGTEHGTAPCRDRLMAAC